MLSFYFSTFEMYSQSYNESKNCQQMSPSHHEMIQFCRQKWDDFLKNFNSSSKRSARISDLMQMEQGIEYHQHKSDSYIQKSQSYHYQHTNFSSHYYQPQRMTSNTKQNSPPYQNSFGNHGGNYNSFRSGPRKTGVHQAGNMKDARNRYSTGRASPSPSTSPAPWKNRPKNYSTGSRHEGHEQGDSPSMSGSYFTPGSTASLSQTPPSPQSPDMPLQSNSPGFVSNI